MYLSPIKAQKFILLSLFSTGATAPWAFDLFLNHGEENRKMVKEKPKEDVLSNNKRLKLFETPFLYTELFTDFLLLPPKKSSEKSSNHELFLENALKKLLSFQLKKYFYKKGWNTSEFNGKIYYKVDYLKFLIEVLLLLQKSIYDLKFSSYDWFEIALKFN